MIVANSEQPHRRPVEPREITLHGHRVSYRTAGSGPLLVLIHGIAGSSATWEEVLPALAEHYTVVAPDLLGHGLSAKPRTDYSLGAYASGIRDLLGVLGYERGTIVGHSLGGGVAMQFAYQFPERCERMVLVSSGGLGHELHLLLRAVALPGAVKQTYEVGGPDPVTVLELLDLVARALGRRPRSKIHVPLGLVRTAARVLDGFPGFPITRDHLLMLQEDSTCDPTPFYSTFDLTPLPLATGLQRMLAP